MDEIEFIKTFPFLKSLEDKMNNWIRFEIKFGILKITKMIPLKNKPNNCINSIRMNFINQNGNCFKWISSHEIGMHSCKRSAHLNKSQ